MKATQTPAILLLRHALAVAARTHRRDFPRETQVRVFTERDVPLSLPDDSEKSFEKTVILKGRSRSDDDKLRLR